MGKWNKAPPEVSEEFLQNQERRKQMIIEAARRRKQKQKKLQEQVEIQKKNEQQALLRHKQQKKDAYVKYLRNNMHDKYEEMKRNQKLNQPQVRTKSKWKKDTLESNSQIRVQNNLEGLDLEVNIPIRNNKVTNTQNNRVINNKVGGQVVRNPLPSQITKNQQQKENSLNNWANSKPQQSKSPSKKQSQKRRLLQDEFQNLWKEEHQSEQQRQLDYDLSMEETIFDDMIGSKLLDSLDLDLDTVSRGKKLDKKMREEKKKKDQKQKENKGNKQIDEIKNMIGYESVLMSIDERSQMIKKYNEFMTNEVKDNQNNQNKTEEPINKTFSKDQLNGTKHNNSKANKPQQPQKPAKSLNEGEVFNELKNKKEGKILNWAQGEAQQADDLFSNCSTNKKSKTRGFQLLKEINKEIQQKAKKPPAQSPNTSLNQQQVNMKKKERPLQTIPQKKINSSLQRLRQRSYDNKKPSLHQAQSTNLLQNNLQSNGQNRSHEIRRSVSKQKVRQVNKQRPNRINSAQNSNPPPQPPRNFSKQRVNKTVTNSFNRENRQNSDVSVRVNSNVTQPIQQQRNRTDSRRSLSKEKEGSKSEKEIPSYGQGYPRNPPLKVEQAVSSARQVPLASNPVKKLPHLPPAYQRPSNTYDQVTIATQDQVFEVQSFIKNELLSLNREERQLQEELKNIHVQNKDKVKEVEKKYEIKTDYKHSYELRQREQGLEDEEDNRTQNSYQQTHKKQTEDELQQSIQRLDDMLLRKEIINKQKGSRITEQDNQSESTHRSLINPMSDPISLHKQVLQLAGNLSKFQGEPQDPTTGYGAKLRMKNKSLEKENKTQLKRPESSTKKRQTEIQLSESQDVNFSELNSVQCSKSKVSKASKVSKPPQLQYSQHGTSANIPPGYNQSGLLDEDDELEDSIEKGKIQVNERLRRMLLE